MGILRDNLRDNLKIKRANKEIGED
ncbi:hypothetical protein CCACVL1_11017 [Corchorus capsularis]|uniref:Uncharacterized protein n=1 Tax=Corchorus capsularis TaxID=210143 RepID=A0A1R3IND0_COCAP|nr:hypothetical protein CCACVL1_11017 [Corchorus capsularis]